MNRLVLATGLLLVMAWAAIAFEPQRLVGEWRGEWSIPTDRGDVYITITKVDGMRVEGTMWVRGPARYHNRDLPFVAALNGANLVATTPTQPGEPPIQWSLDVNDEATQMVGTATGRARSDVKMSKKK
jgi:hypothetical protein